MTGARFANRTSRKPNHDGRARVAFETNLRGRRMGMWAKLFGNDDRDRERRRRQLEDRLALDTSAAGAGAVLAAETERSETEEALRRAAKSDTGASDQK